MKKQSITSNVECGAAVAARGYDAVGELTRIIRHHEQERKDNAEIAGQRALEYVSAIGMDGDPKEWARNQAMEYAGRARTGEDMVRDLREVLGKMQAS